MRQSRIERDDRFFRSREVAGPNNAETRIDIIGRRGERCRYRLEPVTGKKHQLRLHLAALGAPIENDAFYPDVNDALAEDYNRPLQLLAPGARVHRPCDGNKPSLHDATIIGLVRPYPRSFRMNMQADMQITPTELVIH